MSGTCWHRVQHVVVKIDKVDTIPLVIAGIALRRGQSELLPADRIHDLVKVGLGLQRRMLRNLNRIDRNGSAITPSSEEEIRIPFTGTCRILQERKYCRVAHSGCAAEPGHLPHHERRMKNQTLEVLWLLALCFVSALALSACKHAGEHPSGEHPTKEHPTTTNTPSRNP